MLNYYQQVKDQLLCELKQIFEPSEGNEKRLKGINDYMVGLMSPKNMDGNSPHNVLIRQKADFERVCVVLMERGINEPDKLSVLRFHTALVYYETKQSKV